VIAMSADLRRHSRKALAGSLISGVGNYGVYALNVLAQLWLIRFVAPAEFGFYAIATISVEVIYVFSMFEFATVALYGREDENVFHTAIILAIIWTLVTAALAVVGVFVLSGWIDPLALRFFAILLMAKVFFGVGAVYAAFLEKDYKFGQVATIRSVTRAVALLGGAIAAHQGLGAASLLLIDTAYYVSASVLTIAYSPFSVRLDGYRHTLVRSMFKQAGRQTMFRLSGVLLYRSPVLAVEALTSNRALVGAVERGMYFGGLINNIAATFHTKVAFVLFRNLEADVRDIGKFLEVSLWMLSRAAVPVVLLLAARGDVIVSIVFGEGWVVTGELLQGLALFSIAAVIFTLLTQVFLASSRFEAVALVQSAMCLSIGTAALAVITMDMRFVVLARSVSLVFTAGSLSLMLMLGDVLRAKQRLAITVLGPLVAAAALGEYIADHNAATIAAALAFAIAVVSCVDYYADRRQATTVVAAIRSIWQAA